jgi:hypothetical protein
VPGPGGEAVGRFRLAGRGGGRGWARGWTDLRTPRCPGCRVRHATSQRCSAPAAPPTAAAGAATAAASARPPALARAMSAAASCRARAPTPLTWRSCATPSARVARSACGCSTTGRTARPSGGPPQSSGRLAIVLGCWRQLARLALERLRVCVAEEGTGAAWHSTSAARCSATGCYAYAIRTRGQAPLAPAPTAPHAAPWLRQPKQEPAHDDAHQDARRQGVKDRRRSGVAEGRGVVVLSKESGKIGGCPGGRAAGAGRSAPGCGSPCRARAAAPSAPQRPASPRFPLLRRAAAALTPAPPQKVDVTSKTEGKVAASQSLLHQDARLRDNVAFNIVQEVTNTVQVRRPRPALWGRPRRGRRRAAAAAPRLPRGRG